MTSEMGGMSENREFTDIENIKKQIVDGIKKIRCPECNKELDIDEEKGCRDQ